MNFNKIFSGYKQPKSIHDADPAKDFCTMGIFCDYIWRNEKDVKVSWNERKQSIFGLHFPSVEEGGSFIRAINKAVSFVDSEAFAIEITTANDSGDFSKAKNLLKEAVEFSGSKKDVACQPVESEDTRPRRTRRSSKKLRPGINSWEDIL